MITWSELGTAFGELAELPRPARAARLDEIRGVDPALSSELLSLLRAHDEAEGFFEEKIPRLFGSLALEDPLTLEIGERILHFEILEFLGEGSCGRVYLARDEDLGRLVALKIFYGKNHEARNLASFQLEGIVQVYSEHTCVRAGASLRVLCLQFIAGPTLEQVLVTLRDQPGMSLLAAIEHSSRREVAFDPTALKWRELLSGATPLETVVLLGLRIAEVLHHAHGRGVLHLDVKPANILLDAFGRPFLSDFNVSSQGLALGGTPKYMPPEQLKLFEAGHEAETLDARADVFALGVLLKEALVAVNAEDKELSIILDRTTRPNRNERWSSAGELCRELCAWLRRHMSEKEMPDFRRFFSWVQPHPFLALISLTVVSQLIAATINISYNSLQIVASLTEAQTAAFYRAVSLYNLVVYPGLILFAAYSLRALYQRPLDRERARETVLRLPGLLLFVVSVGWLPGAWLVPRMIDQSAGPIDSWIYWQFAGSFGLGWLVSTTTSQTVVLFVLARVLYPRFWPGESGLAAKELKACERWNRLLPFLGALFPMAGALLMVLLAPAEFTPGAYQPFKILLLMTMGLGLLNLLLIQRLSASTEQAFTALKRPRTFD